MENLMSGASRHVIVNPKGGWSVSQSGAARASRVFQTQADAVRYATSVAKKEGTNLYVHRKDGTVSRKDSFGPNPDSSRERR
jgi:hypothetical protein